MNTYAAPVLDTLERWWNRFGDLQEYYSMCLAYGSLVSHGSTRFSPKLSDVELTVVFRPTVDSIEKRRAALIMLKGVVGYLEYDLVEHFPSHPSNKPLVCITPVTDFELAHAIHKDRKPKFWEATTFYPVDEKSREEFGRRGPVLEDMMYRVQNETIISAIEEVQRFRANFLRTSRNNTKDHLSADYRSTKNEVLSKKLTRAAANVAATMANNAAYVADPAYGMIHFLDRLGQTREKGPDLLSTYERATAAVGRGIGVPLTKEDLVLLWEYLQDCALGCLSDMSSSSSHESPASDSDIMPQILLFHAEADRRLASLLSEELRCFRWQSGQVAITAEPSAMGKLTRSPSAECVFCFIVSAGCCDATYVTRINQIREQYSNVKHVVVLMDAVVSQRVEFEPPVVINKQPRCDSRRDIIGIADKVDAFARNLRFPIQPIKYRRNVSLSPNPFSSLLNRGDPSIARSGNVIKGLYELIRTHPVCSVSGMPSSGRSRIVIELIMELSTYEKNLPDLPLNVIFTRQIDGAIPDLGRVCSIVFEALGAPPANVKDDNAAALVSMLDECETWLVLDQFETAVLADGQCRDADLTRFLKIAAEKLDKGRVIVTASTAGIELGDGQRCVNYPVPEWTTEELRRLVGHITERENVTAPAEKYFQELQLLASGNPFFMTVATRRWCQTRVVPKELNQKLELYERLGAYVEVAGHTGRIILQVLDLITTFSASMSLIRRTMKRLQRKALDLRLPEDIDVSAEIGNLMDLNLLAVTDKNGEPCFKRPGLVGVCLEKQYPLEPETRYAIGKELANCILNEPEHSEGCFELLGPAIYDGEQWKWSSAPLDEVGRAVRAADVLISAGDIAYAARLLMGEDKEILKRFNRMAPASVRSSFFSRFRVAAEGDPISHHEATRGLALALVDMAEFSSAISILDEAMDKLDDAREDIDQDEHIHYCAKSLDLKAYCQRQLNQTPASARTYLQALKLLQSTSRDFRDEQCKLLRGLGNSMLAAKDFGPAATYFAQSLEVAKDLSSKKGRIFNEGRIKCDRAILEMLSGKPDKAKESCEEGIKAMRECGDVWNEQIALMNLCGIEREISGDDRGRITAQLKALSERFVELENFGALRVARNLMVAVATAGGSLQDPQTWTFVELT